MSHRICNGAFIVYEVRLNGHVGNREAISICLSEDVAMWVVEQVAEQGESLGHNIQRTYSFVPFEGGEVEINVKPLSTCCARFIEIHPEPYGDSRDDGRTFNYRCSKCKEPVDQVMGNFSSIPDNKPGVEAFGDEVKGMGDE